MRKILLLSIAILLTAGLAQAQTAVTCESTNGKYHECRTTTPGRVVLTRQLSDQNCVDGAVGDVCNEGYCGCTGDMACAGVSNPYDGGMISCEQL